MHDVDNQIFPSNLNQVPEPMETFNFNGENDDSIQRQSINAKYLKVQDADEEVATSLTCWQCAALPSMN